MAKKTIRYKLITIAVVLMALAFVLGGCAPSLEAPDGGDGGSGILSSADDIGLHDLDGGGMNYAFTYGDEEFRTQYLYDCWTIFDSYKITNEDDMKIICQALIDTNPVHGKDLESYRTADDMTYEWQQHNLAYQYLPEDNGWRDDAANVDLDPQDQGRTIEEIYEARTGKDFDMKEYIKKEIEEGDIVEDIQNFFN